MYVVTGGTRGLGLAAARELTADGARVVVSGLKLTPEAAAGVVEKLGGPEQAVVVQADDGDPQTPDRLINEARRAFDRLDGALISVGGPPAGEVQSVTDSSGSRLRDVLPRRGEALRARSPRSWGTAG